MAAKGGEALSNDKGREKLSQATEGGNGPLEPVTTIRLNTRDHFPKVVQRKIKEEAQYGTAQRHEMSLLLNLFIIRLFSNGYGTVRQHVSAPVEC